MGRPLAELSKDMQAWLHQHPHLALCIGISLALGIRLVSLWFFHSCAYFDVLLWDEQYYHDWAIKLLNGVTYPGGVYEYAPLPAYLLAGIYGLFGADPLMARLGNMLLGTGVCVLILFITRRLVPPPWPWVAFLAAAASRELVFFSLVPLKTMLAVFLFGAMILALLAWEEHRQHRQAALLGMLVGLCANVRPNTVLVLVFLLLFLPLHCRKQGDGTGKALRGALVLMLGFMVSVLPFTLRNLLTAGYPAVLPSQSGFLLYASNNSGNSTPFYHPVPFASGHPNEQGVQFTIEAARRLGHHVNSRQAGEYWRKRAVTEVVRNPMASMQRIAGKVAAVCSFHGMDDHYHLPFLRTQLPFLNAPFLPYWLIFSLGGAGLIWMGSRALRAKILLTVSVIYCATLLIYSPGLRFLLPLLTIMIPSAVAFLKAILGMLREKKWKPLLFWSILPMVFFLLGSIPLKATKDLSLAYNTHAFVMNKQGRPDDANLFWQHSVESQGVFSDVAKLFLSANEYRMFGLEKTLYFLNEIPDTSFMVAAKYATIGDLYLHHGYRQQALAAYLRSLSENSGQRRVRRQVIVLLEQIDIRAASQHRQKLKEVERYYQEAS